MKNKLRYPLDKSFGPVGTTSGMILFAAGIVLSILYFSFAGPILILAGAFIGFSYTRTVIDLLKNRILFSQQIFGIIPNGKWLTITPDMKIGIKKAQHSWRAYSRGNRTLDMTMKDFRVMLYDSTGNEILPIRKTKTLEEAQRNITELNKILNLSIQ